MMTRGQQDGDGKNSGLANYIKSRIAALMKLEVQCKNGPGGHGLDRVGPPVHAGGFTL
jgi:hypothetical protein